jgi:hypothetical protein
VVESGSYTFANATALPSRLSLSSGGLLRGIPTLVGNYSFTIVAYGGSSCNGSQSYSLDIESVGMLQHMKLCCQNEHCLIFLFPFLSFLILSLSLFLFFPIGCTLINLAPNTFNAAVVGEDFNATLTISGGTPPYTFSISSGSLPNGLNLTQTTTGILFLSGMPLTAETASFTITITDDAECSTFFVYSLFVSKFLFLFFTKYVYFSDPNLFQKNSLSNNCVHSNVLP